MKLNARTQGILVKSAEAEGRIPTTKAAKRNDGDMLLLHENFAKSPAREKCIEKTIHTLRGFYARSLGFYAVTVVKLRC
jgi:hypothetical protein